MNLGRVADRVAIVTGGGGKGIGSATSLLLAVEGAKVVVVDIDQNQGQETARLINRRGGQARFIRADVTINSNVVQMVDEVIGLGGKSTFWSTALEDLGARQGWRRLMKRL